MSMELHPYLNFDGKTAEAMNFYAEALGGTLQIMRFGDSPMPVPPEHKDRVMHATLRTPGLTIMASDTMPGQPSTPGNTVHLSLNFSTVEEQDRVWEKLSPGATITMPLAQQFFGRFGMLTDRYGNSWMFHFSAQAPQS